jgi:hypothetical protein
MEYKKIKEIVNNYKTKNKEGFTRTEIEDLLEQLNVNERKFNKALGIITCLVINGESITFRTDIIQGILCAVENREQNSLDWD